MADNLSNQQMLAQQQALQAKANLLNMGTDKVADPKSSAVRTYFSRYDGAKYYFHDGGIAVFIGGEYQIDSSIPENELRVKELEYIVDVNQPIFSRTKCVVIKSDGKVLRDIGMAGGGVDPGTVGMLGSVQAAASSARS